MGFVERWAAATEPSLDARLFQVRALIALHLMDAAWARLRDLNTRFPHVAEVHRLTAAMFIGRGWPAQAKKALDTLRAIDPLDAELDALLRRANAPPRPPPNLDEQELDAEVLLSVAEAHLAEGAYLKAEQLIARLPADVRDGSRARDLRWALRSDFRITDAEWAALLDTDVSDILLAQDGTEEIEHTDAVEREDASAMREEASFPSLFRSVSPARARPHRSTEVTETLRIGSGGGVPVVVGAESDSGDTQIARVIRRDADGGERVEQTFGAIPLRTDLARLPQPSSDLDDVEEDEHERIERVAAPPQVDEEWTSADELEPEVSEESTAPDVALDEPEPSPTLIATAATPVGRRGQHATAWWWTLGATVVACVVLVALAVALSLTAPSP